MITLQNTNITSLEVGSMTITWEVKSTSESLNIYDIDIYRAEAPGDISEFDIIASGIDSNLGIYIDSGLQRLDFSINRTIYYYLKAKNTSTLANSDFGPYHMETTPDLPTLEIIRRKNIVLNNPRYGARTFKVLKKRTWGNYCPVCFDPITQQVQSDNCPNCYGTGMEGGYFQPLTIKGYRSDKSYRAQLNMFGKFEETDVAFVLSGSPLIVPNDYLVDEQNNRYLINGPVQHTEKGLYVISQNVRASVVSPTSSVHSFVIT